MSDTLDGQQPLRPVFPWPGAKVRMAEWIVSLMHPSQGYLEPFAGSAAVLLARPRVQHETLNDLDGSIVQFYRALRDRPVALARAVQLTPYAEEEFELALQPPTGDEDDVEIARRFFVRTAQAFQGSAQYPGWGMTVTVGHSTRAGNWKTGIARMEQVAARLQGVQITHRNALSLLKQYAASSGRGSDYRLSIYCDPPYATEDVTLRYQHHDEDLAGNLADVLHQMPAHVHVLVSGYPGLGDDLYQNWQRIERPVLATGGGSSEDGKSRGGGDLVRTEVLWSNQPTWPGVHLDG